MKAIPVIKLGNAAGIDGLAAEHFVFFYILLYVVVIWVKSNFKEQRN